MKPIVTLFFFSLFCFSLHADLPERILRADIPLEQNNRVIMFTENQIILQQSDVVLLSQVADSVSLNRKEARRKKIISAILAFPFPFGMLGVHRIYLGTKPWVPIVYIATVGGCFGILPFIDFVIILMEKDMSYYENNGKIFMWVR